MGAASGTTVASPLQPLAVAWERAACFKRLQFPSEAGGPECPESSRVCGGRQETAFSLPWAPVAARSLYQLWHRPRPAAQPWLRAKPDEEKASLWSAQ